MEKLSPISNKPIATMKEYGYKDHTTLKKILKLLGLITVIMVAVMLYLSISVSYTHLTLPTIA